MMQTDRSIVSDDSSSKKMNNCSEKNPQPDSCWSWVVCVACSISNTIIVGIIISYGIIFPTLLEEFQEGKAITALVGSLAMVGLGIYSTLVAKVYNRWGPRITVTIGAFVCTSAILATSQCNSIYLLLLTYGVIFGFGSCFIFLPSFLVIPRYFIKRRSLAVGIITMGVGGSLLVTSPIIKALLDALGWRKMFMVLAGFVALTIPLVFTIQTLPPEVAEEQLDDDTAEGFFEGVRSVVRNQRFAIIFLSMNLFYIVIYIPSVHMVRYCEDLKISRSQASKLYLYSGLMSMVCRPLIGWLCDVKCIDAVYIYQLVAGIDGVATLLLPLARRYFHFVLYFIVYGLADGAVGCSSCIAILSCFTSKKRSLAFGLTCMVSASMAAAGPPLAGLLADEVGSYEPAFYMTGTVMLLAALVIFLIPLIRSSTQSREAVFEELIIAEKCTVV
ncbi:Monocarboxylate transporter 4 [Acropora cervicornis]|uniref:Monocarboxylate transporter 4 n=1 Tax=Acropora cervicornis TaxID=6130 RepID=A0AAD9VEQ1_ACRCE|nr:Monocarboxylate transporter 4 [Acropora cervicornis]